MKPLVAALASVLLLAGCASGAANVTLPDVAGDTSQEKFVNTLRGGLLEHFATWSSDDVLRIGTTFCQVMANEDDPEAAAHSAAEDSYLEPSEVDFVIKASWTYLCPNI